MRYAVLSDIHANVHALERVVASVERLDVDGYLCTGDLVGYGPAPNECVERVVALGARCVAGNHDLIAVGALSEQRSGTLARQSLAWTRTVLTARTRAFLAGLPRTRKVDGLLLAHGSVDDPEEYIRTPEQAVEVLDGVEDPQIDAVLLGHTHHQWAVGSRDGELLHRSTGRVALRRGQRHLLNAGSVGQSRDSDALARFLVLDTVTRVAEFHAVEYDIARCASALRRAGLPVRGLDVTDRSFHELSRGVRRRLARLGDRVAGPARRVP